MISKINSININNYKTFAKHKNDKLTLKDILNVSFKENNSDIFILGTGIAGLITAWYYRNYNVFLVGDKLGGQMSSEIPLGPRIIQKDNNTLELLKKLNIKNLETAIAKITYCCNNSKLCTEAPDWFIEKYSEISRGSSLVEEHTMSENKNEIEYFKLSYNNFMEILIAELQKYSNIKIVEDKVIEIKNNCIICENDTYVLPKTCKKISTIILPIFLNLIKANGIVRDQIKTQSKKVNFYKSIKSDISKFNKHYLEYFNTDILYTYYANNDGHTHPYHRKTITNENTIYESVNDLLDNKINSNKATIMNIEYLTSIPKIVNNNIKYSKILNWMMIGRFAEWDQSIKLNELLENFKQGNYVFSDGDSDD